MFSAMCEMLQCRQVVPRPGPGHTDLPQPLFIHPFESCTWYSMYKFWLRVFPSQAVTTARPWQVFFPPPCPTASRDSLLMRLSTMSTPKYY